MDKVHHTQNIRTSDRVYAFEVNLPTLVGQVQPGGEGDFRTSVRRIFPYDRDGGTGRLRSGGGISPLSNSGDPDGTRTRDLRRDRAAR